MTNIGEVVTVTVTAATGALAREGFGTPMVAYYHTKTLARMVEVSGAQEALDLGFTRTTDAALFNVIDTVFAQDPKPSKLKIGRLTAVPGQTLTITVVAAVEGDKILLQVNDVELEYIVPPAATTTTVATALTALILGAVATSGATSALAVISLAPTGNTVVRLRNWTRALSLKSTGIANANLAADLDAIFAEDSDFTGFDLVSMNEAESKVAALFVEANGKLFFPTFYDTEIKDSLVTTDAISDLKALLYKNTSCWYSQKDTHSHMGLALFGRLGAQFAPGGENFAHKQISAVLSDTPDTMRSGELNTVRTKNGNVYFPVFKKPITWEGVRADGGWIDSRRFLLWQAYDIAISVFEAISNQPGKLAYDSTGRNVLESAAENSMGRGVDSGGWTQDVPIQVVLPTVEFIRENNPQLLLLRQFPKFQAIGVEAGAINATAIEIISKL